MPKLTPIHKPTIHYHAPRGALTHGRMTPVRVVLHDTECGDAPGDAEIEGVVRFWMGTPDKLGAQFIVDKDGLVGQCGEPGELMYHTGGANTGSVGIEQIGFARFAEKDWLARPDQLLKVAKLLAWLNKEYGIPLRVSTSFGISTHAMQSAIHPDSAGHTDPGKGYPLEHVIDMARDIKHAGGWLPDSGGGAVTKPKPKPQPRRVWQITYTNKHGHRHTTTSFSPGLWLVGHPKAKRRGDVVIHPAGRMLPPKT